MAAKNEKTVAKAMGIEDYKPTIQLDKSLYPDIGKLKIDDVVELNVKVKITDLHRQRWQNNKLCATGEIQNAEPEEYDDEDD